jgi:hypothetical protein
MMLGGVLVGYPPFLFLRLRSHVTSITRIDSRYLAAIKISPAAHAQRILPFILIDHKPDFVSTVHVLSPGFKSISVDKSLGLLH